MQVGEMSSRLIILLFLSIRGTHHSVYSDSLLWLSQIRAVNVSIHRLCSQTVIHADRRCVHSALGAMVGCFSTPRPYLLTRHHEGKTVTDDMPTVFLSLHVCEAGDDAIVTWRRQCEAISVFMLASEIKPSAFFRAAQEHCRYNWELFVGVEPMSFELSVSLKISLMRSVHQTWPSEALARLFFPKEDYSDAYETTRTALLRLIDCPEKRRECECKVFPVLILMDSAINDERIASILRRIIQLQSVRQIATQGVRLSTCCFFPESVDLRVSNTSYSDELLRSVELVASKPGLRLRFVHFGLSNWDKDLVHSNRGHAPLQEAVSRTMLASQKVLDIFMFTDSGMTKSLLS